MRYSESLNRNRIVGKSSSQLAFQYTLFLPVILNISLGVLGKIGRWKSRNHQPHASSSLIEKIGLDKQKKRALLILKGGWKPKATSN